MSGEVRTSEVEARIGRLEGEVARLSAELRSLAAGAPGAEEAAPGAPAGTPGAGTGKEPWLARLGERHGELLRAEWWFTRGGVVLLLFGVAFLFKLSVDEGWITPAVRVAFGLALGGGLLGLGLRTHRRRPVAGQAMLGGGLAALYASAFAAHTLYALVPLVPAFAFAVLVTAGAFALAIRQDAATLSGLGLLGGLATPFVLYDGEGSVAGLALYTGLLLGASAAVYVYRGWRTLLALAAAGSLLVLYTAALALWPSDERSVERAALVGALAFCWLAVTAAPALRSFALRKRAPQRSWTLVCLSGSTAFSLLSLLALSDVLGFDSGRAAGYVLLGGAVVHALAALGLGGLRSGGASRFRDGGVVYAQAGTAVALGTVAAAVLLPAPALVVALAGEAFALRYVAGRSRDPLARDAAAGLFGVLAFSFALEVAELVGTRFYEPPGAGMLVAWAVAVGLAALAGVRLTQGRESVAYRLGAHGAFLALLVAGITPQPGGGVWTKVAWGAYGCVLVALALRSDAPLALRVGFATLVLVAGKLTLVDLFWVEALHRTALFLGFGALFLALGYGLRSLWKPRDPGIVGS